MALLAALLWPGFALAQAPPLITDRPDFTESPFVVPLGSIQVEAGMTRTLGRQLRSIAAPEALIRWSPASRLELRFEPPGYLDAEASGVFTDVALGMKLELGRFSAWSVGAIASIGLPTGDTEASAGRVVPEIIVATGRDLDNAWSLGAQASAARPNDGGGVTLAYTVVTGRALTQRLGAFVELAAEREPGAATGSLLHTGLTFSLSPSMQLDVHAAKRVTGENTSS